MERTNVKRESHWEVVGWKQGGEERDSRNNPETHKQIEIHTDTRAEGESI